jgi:hypothetical protein
VSESDLEGKRPRGGTERVGILGLYPSSTDWLTIRTGMWSGHMTVGHENVYHSIKRGETHKGPLEGSECISHAM